MADFLTTHWLAMILGVLGLVLVGAVVLRRQTRFWQSGWFVVGGAALLVGAGGLCLPADWAFWITIAALTALFLQLSVLVVFGEWRASLGFSVAAMLGVGVGGLVVPECSRLLVDVGQFVVTLEPLQPGWLVLLLLVPALVALGFRSLAGLGVVRRWIVIGLRSLSVALLVLALAETHARQPNENLTVLFAWDRSLSIPHEYENGKDVYDERIKRFINDAVKARGAGKEDDRAGVLVFGRTPRLELPPAKVPELRFHKIASILDNTYTDIAAAIKLALASFPEGTGKRLVLISDGVQNLGDAEEQARIAKQNGVQIYVVPLADGRRSHNEVLVGRVEAPPVTEKGARLPLRIVLRSYHPQVVAGNLQLIKIALELKKVGEQEQPVFEAQPILTTEVKLRQGLNVFYFQEPGSRADSYTYEAKFVPTHVERDGGAPVHKGLPGDRIENNRANTTVIARGQRNILLIEPKAGDHELLVNRLLAAKTSMKVVAIEPEALPQDPAQLALVLSKFDSVIIANVPAEKLSEEQQKVFRSNTHDQGSGLIMVGGPQGFGAGGWQGTEVEKALPVTADLKSAKVEGKSGLVLIMHASEMADGNAWQKKIAKLSIEKLSPLDMVGLIFWDWDAIGGKTGHRWHIPFQLVGQNRGRLMAFVDSMNPGDMPDVDPALTMAYNALINPLHQLGTKHIIFISDGDHWRADPQLLTKIRLAGITCTTVCITTHGNEEVQRMAAMAALTKGRSYHVKDGNELPAIYIKETRLVSKAFTHEKKFQPELAFRGGPTEGIADLPPLHGFVRTTKRPALTVEMPIQTEKIGDQKWPLLAYWQYGLGKGVAFASDARTQPGGPAFWDRDWANSQIYGRFWEQTVEWSLRAVETGKHLTISTEQRGDRIRVIVDAKDDKKLPLTNVKLEAGLTSPGFKPGDAKRPELNFEQKNSGVYEAEFKADEVGSYFIHVQAKWTDKDGKEKNDSVRAGVTLPYSPEFAEMESNTALLERIRDITGGKTISDDDASLRRAIEAGDVFRALPLSHGSLQPLWMWLVMLAGVCLFFDVAVRRITIDPLKMSAAAQTLWLRLRGRQVEVVPAYIERLRTRKAQVGETIDKDKAVRRFAGEAPVTAVLAAPSEAPVGDLPPRRPAPAQRVGPEQSEEAQDFASRLMRAKKKAMEEREKRKE